MTIRMLLGLGASLLLTVACADGSDTDGSGTGAGSANGGSNAGGGAASGGSGGSGGTVGSGGGPSDGSCAIGNAAITFACNPVTNENCSDTQACDLSGAMNFACYSDNASGLGEMCNQLATNGPFCQAGLTCFKPDPANMDGVGTLTECARYCCTDGDCDAAGGGVCTKTFNGGAWFKQSPDIGVCQ